LNSANPIICSYYFTRKNLKLYVMINYI
jgi:hypothetical protein